LDEADKDQSGPASITGPFKVVADQTFGRGTFRRLIVFVEPKLHVIACARQARIEEAVDAAGEDIRLETLDPFRGRLGEFEDIDSNALVIEMPRLNPARGRAAYLKGTVPIRVAASEQTSSSTTSPRPITSRRRSTAAASS
jgi:hypothetical protein